MTIAYRLTPYLRRKLKKPLGTIIRGSFKETMNRLKEIVEVEKPLCIIAVGDAVSRSLVENNILPHIVVVDNKCMRKSLEEPLSFKAEKTFSIKNPQATITEEAISALQDSLKRDVSVQVVVDGEEDLLTLIAVLYAPENSFVIYGQPHEGIVVIRTTLEKKAEIAEILRAMENVRKAK
jgi:uncharacterized protein (UPF0218 family)